MGGGEKVTQVVVAQRIFLWNPVIITRKPPRSEMPVLFAAFAPLALLAGRLSAVPAGRTLSLAPRAPCVSMIVKPEALETVRAEMEVLRAQRDAAEAEVSQLKRELAELHVLVGTSVTAQKTEGKASDGALDEVFDAVDGNGDGVLDISEFRKGYELLTDDAVLAAFETLDDNGDGVLTKQEFRKGYALLTSDSARGETPAEDHPCLLCYTSCKTSPSFGAIAHTYSFGAHAAAAERERVDEAVAAERIRAVKQAARNLAEAQLMDTLFTPSTQAP